MQSAIEAAQADGLPPSQKRCRGRGSTARSAPSSAFGTTNSTARIARPRQAITLDRIGKDRKRSGLRTEKRNSKYPADRNVRMVSI